MGASQLKACCNTQEQSDEPSKPNQYKIIASDYMRFSHQQWFTFQNPILFDPNKFIFLYPNYEQEQSVLLQRWKQTVDIKNIEYGQNRREDDVMSTRWKYAIKRGVPIEYYKVMISVIFNKNYQSLNSKQLFDKLRAQTNFSQNTPLFGIQEPTLREAACSPYLNDKGYAVLKQLLHMIKRKKGQMFYNKYIVQVTAMLLIFFQDHQAFDLISTMMDQSFNMTTARTQSLRWHFIFREQQMKGLANRSYALLRSNSDSFSKLEKCFQRNNIDKVKLFNGITQNFFYGFLPFSFILSILMLFLNEGVKVFIRIFYAILRYSQVDLSNATSLDRCYTIIRKRCLNLSSSQIRLILKNSYNLRLKGLPDPKFVQANLLKQKNQRRYYYIPMITGISQILTFDDLQQIWNLLPCELRSFDIQVRYPPRQQNKSHSLNLQDLLKSIAGIHYTMIVIKSEDNAVFGCFFYAPLDLTVRSQWYGSPQNFVFRLGPKPKKYTCTRQNSSFVWIGDRDELKVGDGPIGPGLKLSAKLLAGESYQCNTFRNEPLNNQVPGQFKITAIESFSIY